MHIKHKRTRTALIGLAAGLSLPSFAANQAVAITIESQPLEKALQAFSAQTRKQVTVDADAVRGLTSPEVNGDLTPLAALRKMIDGTGLVLVRVNENDFSLRAGNAEETAEYRATDKLDRSLERITIRGVKQNLTLQEVDSSVELITQDRLDAERIVDLNDVLGRIPNVVSTGSSGDFAIRGISRNGATGVGRGVSSNVYIDGAPLSSPALGRSLTSLWDVQQVEVLRGSQSSVQGRNALAGSVVISTADPTFTPEGKFRATYAEDNTYQLAGAYSAPIIDDELAFRVAVDVQKTDGFIAHIHSDKKTNHESRTMVRGKLLYKPKAIENLTVKLTVDHNDNDIGESRPIVTTGFNADDPRFVDFDIFDFMSSGTFPQNETKGTRVVLDTNYALTKHWSLNGIMTYEDTEVDRQFGFQDKLVEFNGYASNRFESRVKSAELRLNFDYDKVSGVIGGYYYDEFNPSSTYNELLLNPEVVRLTQGFGFVTPDDAVIQLAESSEVKTENVSLFAQIRAELNEQWTVDFGLRYDKEDFNHSGVLSSSTSVSPDSCTATVPGVLLGIPQPLIQLPCGILAERFAGAPAERTPEEASYNALLPKLSLSYKMSDEHLVFASVQRGYRAGGSYLTKVVDSNIGGNRVVVDTYEPEYLNTVEVGSRSEFADGEVILNTNIFYSKYKDQQVSLPGLNLADITDDVIVNASESTMLGAELMLEYFVNQELDVFVSLGLLDTEFDDFPYADKGPYSNLAGNKQPSSPDVTASLGVNWNSDSGWFANLSAFYTGSRFVGVENLDNAALRQPALDAGIPAQVANEITEEVDAYINLNGRFGYNAEDYSVYLFVTNLLDEKVVTAMSRAGVDQASGEIIFSTGGTNSTVIPPRAVGVGLDYRF